MSLHPITRAVVLLALCACAAIAHGQTAFPTVAGELKITEVQRSCVYEVTLAGKPIAHTDCNRQKSKFADAPTPSVLLWVNREVGAFAQVIVFQQQMMGNACNGGPLWFLGVKPGGEYAISEPIDFCGGPDPVITVESKAIDVLLPGGPRNIGRGRIPAEHWRYENGQVTRLKSGKRQP